MGADQFTNRKFTSKPIAEAFTEERNQALYDHGHSGYSGTIAEKSEFVIRHDKFASLPDAAIFAAADLDEHDHDKWGPAWAVEFDDQLAGHGYIFYGWASS